MMIRLIFLILWVGLGGCGHDMAVRKQQSEASRNLGEAYMVQGDYISALRELLQAQELYADDPYLQNNLGLAYLGRGRPDLALRHFEQALKLNPAYAPALNNKGATLLALEDWDAAIVAFLTITDDLLYSTPHYPLANLGWAYYNKRDYAQAERYYREALNIEPEFLMALQGLARTHLLRGNTAEAITLLERARRSFPRQPEVHLDLGRAYIRQHQYSEAAQSFEQVLMLVPEDSELARVAREQLRGLPQ